MKAKKGKNRLKQNAILNRWVLRSNLKVEREFVVWRSGASASKVSGQNN